MDANVEARKLVMGSRSNSEGVLKIGCIKYRPSRLVESFGGLGTPSPW
jgi:hypothetical protein